MENDVPKLPPIWTTSRLQKMTIQKTNPPNEKWRISKRYNLNHTLEANVSLAVSNEKGTMDKEFRSLSSISDLQMLMAVGMKKKATHCFSYLNSRGENPP